MLQAALAGGTAHRRSVFELFPRRLPEGRRYGVVAGVGRALDALEDFRFDDEALDGSWRDVVDEPTLRLAGRLPLHRRHLGLRRGRGLLPLLAAAGRRGHVRRGGAARDAAALDLQPRLGDRLGGVPDDHAPPATGPASRWARAAPTRRRRWRPPARRTSPASRPPPTSPPGSGTACRPPAPAPTASRCSTTPRPTRSGRRSRRSGTGTTLLVDTYDVAEAVRLGVEVAGTGLGAVRLDSGDLGVLAREVRAAARRPRRDRDPDHGDQRPRRVRHRRAGLGAGRRATASAPSWSPARGHPTCGFVYKLVAREGDDGAMVSVAKKSTDKVSHRRPQVRAAPASTPRASPRPRWSASATPPVDDGDDRPLLVPLVRGRRGRRPRAARRPPAPATRRPAPSCRWPRSRCRAASR